MPKNYFITGGAGFIGSNYVYRLLERGEKVTVYDNLSRAGAPRNLKWLQDKFGEKAFNLVIGDVRDAGQLPFRPAKRISLSTSPAGGGDYLGRQTARGLRNQRPGHFQRGGSRATERAQARFYLCLHNKVYGGMEDVNVVERGERWSTNPCPSAHPKPSRSISIHLTAAPKAQRSIRPRLRPHLRSSIRCPPSKLHLWPAPVRCGGSGLGGLDGHRGGDGSADHHLRRCKQIRDLLHVYDLLDAYDAAIQNIDKVQGRSSTLGGGPKIPCPSGRSSARASKNCSAKPSRCARDWRPGDQKVFVADIAKPNRCSAGNQNIM